MSMSGIYTRSGSHAGTMSCAACTTQGIGAGIHYPVPVHLQPAFRHLGYRPGDFPVAEAAARQLLSLPLYPQITQEQQVRVADAVRRALG